MRRADVRRAAAAGGLALSGAVVLVLAAAAPPASGAADRAVQGDFVRIAPASNHLPGLNGSAQLVRTGGGKSKLTVHVKGLTSGVTYGVHLHAQPCSLAGNPGGPHYKHSASGPGEPPNELWASDAKDPKAGITANKAGSAHGKGTASWVAGPTAQAVVIHDSRLATTAGGPKLACLDLR